MAAIFTYGTLMFEPVWRAVLGEVAQSPAPALIEGFQRYRVQGELYPAVIRAAGEQVPGMLYSGVTDEQIATLDAFEGTDYQRTEVTAIMSASVNIKAGVYLFLRPELLEYQAWDPDQFEREHIDAFLDAWPGPNRAA